MNNENHIYWLLEVEIEPAMQNMLVNTHDVPGQTPCVT
jgi:hypothetical protein